MEYGILSVVPSVLAIILALTTKNVFIALFVSLMFGNLILSNWNIMGMIVGTKEVLINVFQSTSSTSIIFILLLFGGMFYLVEVAGGLKGFTTLMTQKRSVIKSRVGAEIFTWIIGVLVFIDGTLSVMIAGSIARPLTRTYGISPEKTAWIVHSTATPMSILVPFAAYGPYIASFIEAQGIANPTQVMVQSIFFNFYCIFAVLGVALFVVAKFDFGPMKRAEEEYMKKQHKEIETDVSEGNVVPASQAKYLLIPMLLMIFGAVAYLLYSGEGNIMNGDAETGLILGTVAGSLYIIISLAIEKKATIGKSVEDLFKGCGNMIGIVAIMVFAYGLSNMLGSLNTAVYLSDVLVQFLSPAVFTAIAFIFTCLLSFSTGTSAGTIAIMLPILLPMALAINVNIPLIVGAIAGGAVFGDHASPISDTTVMTCSSTECDVISHVKTQLPYSLCFAGVACALYLVLGFVM